MKTKVLITLGLLGLLSGLFATRMVAAGAKTKGDYEKVIVTRNPDDVKGLARIGDVSASAKKAFGDQAVLREAATVKIKKAAAKKGATIVLIQVDNFGMSPINNVSMAGVAYAAAATAGDPRQEAGESSPEEKKDSPTAAKTESDWEKVVVTRNNDDVKGLARIDDVTASAKKVFGDQTALRETATISLKKAAAKKGASIVLIQVDNFAMTPINNVSLVGVAYR
jgi:hypothetical protein